jgi:hypothetical protein
MTRTLRKTADVTAQPRHCGNCAFRGGNSEYIKFKLTPRLGSSACKASTSLADMLSPYRREGMAGSSGHPPPIVVVADVVVAVEAGVLENMLPLTSTGTGGALCASAVPAVVCSASSSLGVGGGPFARSGDILDDGISAAKAAANHCARARSSQGCLCHVALDSVWLILTCVGLLISTPKHGKRGQLPQHLHSGNQLRGKWGSGEVGKWGSGEVGKVDVGHQIKSPITNRESFEMKT